MAAITISKDTLRILANFAEINGNIFVRSTDGSSNGHVITTINGAKNLFAEAAIPEQFPASFGIWDLHKLLSIMSTFTDPTLDFDLNDSYVQISGVGTKNKVKYYLTAENLLTVPTKKIAMPKHAIEFTVPQESLAGFQKAATILSLPDLCVTPGANHQTVQLTAMDKNDPTSNTFTMECEASVLGRKTDFKLFLKIENLLMIPGNYSVKLAEKAISEWKKDSGEISYIIAMDKDSVYP